MMKNLTHTIPAQTCPEAWVRAVEYLIDQAPKREAYYLTLAIESPEKMTPNDFRVFDLVDDFLRSHGQPPLTTVAGTIFPANYYLRGGAEGVYEDFPGALSKMDRCSSWGTYAMRMLRKDSKGDTINPLQVLVEKLKNYMRRMRAAYDINFADEDDAFELPIYGVEDANRLRQQPCLSHLSFKLYPDDALTLAAVYRSHYYVSKALGNLLGLAQLQSFVATETGLTVGPLICYSTHARIDPSPFKIADIKGLLSQCKTALSAPLPNVD